MIRLFVFVLAVFGLVLAAALVILGSFALLHRHTHSRAAFWLWLTGLVVYVPAVIVGIHAAVWTSGLADWALS